MTFETLFSLAGLLAMAGWLILLLSPLMPRWSDRISGLILPVLLSIGYLALVLFPTTESGGGFGSLAEVMQLFSYEQAALAGWVHFLAFDLFIGAWACRKARSEGMAFWIVLPCLPLIFMIGPVGLLVFLAARGIRLQMTRA
ncbi:DUF4281 domain-containing protein [Lentibacter algarum]|uniref:ABA4-like family protein n=1 Tax=Lentibacter algarum TaxID=576131 RepID=UPI001C07A554|nr:ABA4-like family protein [Lentibacter algarum]MBU2981759.1 DUF4281 domain-containing protein [Lentibacter algarum]